MSDIRNIQQNIDTERAYIETLFQEHIRTNELDITESILTLKQISDDLYANQDARSQILFRLNPNQSEFSFEEFRTLTELGHTEHTHAQILHDVITTLGKERENASERSHIFSDIHHTLINMDNNFRASPRQYEDAVYAEPHTDDQTDLSL